MSDKGTLMEPRLLTHEGSTLLRWLLENSDPRHRHLTAQIPDLTVIWECPCGCPTVNFALNGKPFSRIGSSPIADYLAKVDGEDVGVMLFEYEGQLTSLEVYSCAGTDQPFGLPPVTTLGSY